jgi:hypothetical protein
MRVKMIQTPFFNLSSRWMIHRPSLPVQTMGRSEREKESPQLPIGMKGKQRPNKSDLTEA